MRGAAWELLPRVPPLHLSLHWDRVKWAGRRVSAASVAAQTMQALAQVEPAVSAVKLAICGSSLGGRRSGSRTGGTRVVAAVRTWEQEPGRGRPV